MTEIRDGLWIPQTPRQVVNISKWHQDEEFGIYPEGKRDKNLLYAPTDTKHAFLIPGHKYLFKWSMERHPDQFWTEVIAYRIGSLMGIPVPPTFIAYDFEERRSGALVEWFLERPGQNEERLVPGGDYFHEIMPEFDRKKGEKHNFSSIISIFRTREKRGLIESDWLRYWCDMLLFDAVIGNTDRHQDNWGLLWYKGKARMAPVFDNGTSLGYEILEKNFQNFKIDRYIQRGKHHLRWHFLDNNSIQHFDLLRRLIELRDDIKDHMREVLWLLDKKTFNERIFECCEFDVPAPLSHQRATFICKLIESRSVAITMQLGF